MFLLTRRSFRFFYIVFFTIIFPALSFAQKNNSASLNGFIYSSDSIPVENIIIHLLPTDKFATTNGEGHFQFSAITNGNYELLIKGYKFSDVHIQIAFREDSSSSQKIFLPLKDRELREVTVSTSYNRFYQKETDDIARLPLKNIENPQVYTVVPNGLMQEQIITDYNSIFKNIPGAGIPVVYNQGRSAMLSRGFTTANLMRNSVSGFVYTNIDPANVERVEAIKGPSGTLFNSSMISFGGLFNRVTKRPLEIAKSEISYLGGSFSLSRLTYDINQPLNESKTALFRINGSLHTEKSFQDAGFDRHALVAPSFLFKLNPKATLLFDIEASTFTGTSPVRYAPATKTAWLPYNLSFLTNSLAYTTKSLNVFAQFTYELSAKWKLQSNLTRTYSTTEGYVTQLIGLTDSTLRQRAQIENFPYNGTNFQQNLIGDFRIGSLRNRLVVGVEVFNQRSDRNTPTITMPTINFRKLNATYYNFNKAKIDSAATKSPYSTYQTNIYSYSAYASDVVNITDRFNIMMSLRVDRFRDKGTYFPINDSSSGAYMQTAYSPKFGAVYELIKNHLSVFGNYMNGFNNQTGQDVNGSVFKPQQGNQWEGGLKADIWSHRLTATISYYNIKVNNSIRQDPKNPGFSIQDGTQVSKGIDAELIANPFSGFNLLAGYSYNDSKYTLSDSSVMGLRPATAGPANMFNFWASYRIKRSSLNGLGFGFGGNMGGTSYQTNTHAFQFVLPSYTILDATLFYEQPTYRFGIKMDNITNQKYYSFRLAPQNPTRYTLSFTYKF